MLSPTLTSTHMKKTLFALPLLLAASSHASIIAFDNFDYGDGSLVPNGGWASHSGTAGDLLVSGGQAVVQHGTPSEDANLAFTAVGGTIYFGLDFSVDDLGAPYSGTNNEFFAHFKDNGTNFAARLDIVAPAGSGDFTVGIASDESTADAIWATDLSFDTVYRAIVGYNQSTNLAQLWIDATLSTGTSILGEDRSDPGDTVTQFALRQSDSSENETVRVDGLVIGTTFDDVVAPVPEPATSLLGALGLLALLRRKR